MRLRLLLCAALCALPFTPATAQERVLTIFGDDRCPVDTICVRAPERDRYRIPKQLRETKQTPDSQSWATRSQAAMSEGKSGAGSCSAAGAGGWTGCWAAQMRAAREEAKARAAEKAE